MQVIILLFWLCQQNPAADEQLLIYELNRARNNPQRYASENGLGSLLDGIAPSPPLALNTRLVQSSGGHAEEMAANDYFGHQSAVTLKWPNRMARDAGYVLPAAWPDDQNYIESIAAGYSSVLTALRGLLEDALTSPPGHRYQLLATGPQGALWLAHREVGTGHGYDASSTYDNYYAIHTAYVNSSDLFLTGVVYDDLNTNSRYDLNEGLGGVLVSLGATSTTTNSAGGWSIPITNGSYTLTVSGGSFVGTATANVTVAGSNIEADFISGSTAGEVGFGNQPPPPPPPPPGGTPGGACGSTGLDLLWPLGLLWLRRRSRQTA